MRFSEVVEQVIALLQRQGRVSYRALKREFDLDNEYLEDLKAEIIKAQRLAVDEDGEVLVWKDSLASSVQRPAPEGQSLESDVQRLESETQRQIVTGQTLDPRLSDPRLSDPRLSAAERRQLTVMFCDLVGSTALSEQLDPEELREVVRAYQETCTEVIRGYDGYVAQHLGDGLLVYFGYPAAHEDDARRAVRAALAIVAALQIGVPSPLRGEGQGEGEKLTPLLDSPHPSPLPQGAREFAGMLLTGTRKLQVRIGIHTGPVVVGEIGSGEKREILALGETPNVAARVQGLADPDTVVISAGTQRLVVGLFECQDLGLQTLKGISTPMAVYQALGEGSAQSRFDVAVQAGLTPLVGRELEVGLLQDRWQRVTQSAGQVVLLSGEPGIGKSRLVQALKEHVSHEGATRLELRCSPYHQHSAYFPILDHLQRLLQFTSQDTPQTKLDKLTQTLSHYHFPQADTLPLLASFLSLPHPEQTPPLTMSPQKQKEKTQAAIVAWLVEEAENAPVYCAWEDLHWADPSTLELLTLLLAQVPASRLLVLLTFRPEFTPPWGPRSYLSQLTLSRLDRIQVEAMVERVTGGKALPPEIMQQIVAKTDGVPLFVEELTKTVLETIREQATRNEEQEDKMVGAPSSLSSLQLGIPATLQDALMARLDRLGPPKEIAQLGATIGREFNYGVLHAVSTLTEEALQYGLRQLVRAELVYQSGVLPQARYLFKHALIQDTAYQALLKSTRQQYHRQIAQVLAERFPEIVETQPELLAHHYTEAGLKEQAIPYWQQAGQRAVQRSAHAEAVAHLTKGLELLKTLPDTPERAQQELMLQIALGRALMATKGYAAPEVGKAYARARELCSRVGETPQLFPVLWGLCAFYTVRGELQTANALGTQMLRLAQSVQDPALLLEAHHVLGQILYFQGELVPAREHLEQGIALYDPQQHHSHAFLYGHDPGVACHSYAAFVLWYLGYPDQALQRSHEALTLAQGLSHPYSLAYVRFAAARLHQLRQEGQTTQERAEALISLSAEQGFVLFLTTGPILRGWALAGQGRVEEGIAQIRQGLTAFSATGAAYTRAHFLALLAETFEKAGQVKEGLTVLAEALAVVDKTGERYYEAELYRLKGALTLQQLRASPGQVQNKSQASHNKSEFPNTQHPTPSTEEKEAESCFLKAIEVAQRQHAKSWELRATTSLACLWRQQDKKAEAHKMLADVYKWFTEGFDTKDLQEAKALLEELSH